MEKYEECMTEMFKKGELSFAALAKLESLGDIRAIGGLISLVEARQVGEIIMQILVDVITKIVQRNCDKNLEEYAFLIADLLNGSSPVVCNMTLSALESIFKKDATPKHSMIIPLLRASKTITPQLRSRVSKLLDAAVASIQSSIEAATVSIVYQLSVTDPSERNELIEALKEPLYRGGPQSIEKMVTSLNNLIMSCPDNDIKAQASLLLAHAAEKRPDSIASSLPLLAYMTCNRDLWVSRNSVAALACIASSCKVHMTNIVSDLIVAWGTNPPPVRGYIEATLQIMEENHCVPTSNMLVPLVRACFCQDPTTRDNAWLAAAQISRIDGAFTIGRSV